MPRYAILEHDHPTRHWDFLLEERRRVADLATVGAAGSGRRLDAVKMFDHRRLYLDYEGPVERRPGPGDALGRRDV